MRGEQERSFQGPLFRRKVSLLITQSAFASQTPRPKGLSRRGSILRLGKTFWGGALTIAGASSATRLISEIRGKFYKDEVDYYPPTIGHAGDLIATSLECSVTFWDRKIVHVSRPSVVDLLGIDACIADSDERYFNVPCHKCGEFQPLE